MEDTAYRAIAIVGAGAIMPDAPNVAAFWNNVKTGRNCISEVPADRWDPNLYYDSDHGAPDKTYSKIGGWVREFVWDPMKWRLPLPPRVVNGMDDAQKWAIACAREALEDYGYPKRPLDSDRTAVILGSALGGEKHYLTCLRVYFPEYARELGESASFATLPEAMRRDITRELHNRIEKCLPEITEDSMPGELSNCLAGRIANIYNFRGPNFTTDAACASAMAALTSAAHGLVANDFDVAIAGGIDRNMGASSFVKFCKIGALSATGTRPYAEGADGFVMGEGAAVFLLKRLADAERDGDKIYAVLRGIAGSSDGKGKGITAPNPAGQKLAVERAWKNAGVSPTAATLIEGHGTSTKVGDVVETQSMAEVFGRFNLPVGSVALGSVKSNIGHLKGAAGAAGLLKVVLALRDKVLPPSANCPRPNPDIDFSHSPLYVNTELKPWNVAPDGVRSAGLSAFGFGGTNFHAVLEEYIPHRITGGNGKRSVAFSGISSTTMQQGGAMNASPACKTPLRGAMVIGAASAAALTERLRSVQKAAEAGSAPPPAAPAESDLRAPERLAIDYADAAELADKAGKALKAMAANQPPIWKALRAQGIFRGQGPAPKVAFLYTGQGSQYVNMLQDLRAAEPIVAETFAEADGVLTPILGKPLTEFIFVNGADADAVAKAEEDLRQTAITQPAVIASDIALTRLAAAYGIKPDMAMGHSVGEYGALAASGALPFVDAMEAVSARGREMTNVSFEDNGKMAAVFAPIPEIERILKTIDGYVVTANINSNTQAVIGGTSKAIEQAIETFLKAGYNAVPLSVSHAFHTKIVAPASVSFGRLLARLRLQPPQLPIISNITGEFYPTGPDVVPTMLEMLATQIATPVQFVKGLETLYNAGVRVFVEMGPKKALQGFADDVLGGRADVVSLFTNHPKLTDAVAFNQALCGLYAAGLGRGQAEISREASVVSVRDQHATPAWTPVTITGAALGLPGTERVFDDSNVSRIMHGEQFIDVLPNRLRKAQVDKNVTRLMKNDNGGPTFELITKTTDVIRLAARGGAFEIDKEFGIASERLDSMDQTTRLAMAAGLDALRDAGIPLVLHYKTTTRGTQIPDRWLLPESMRDDTGVIFGSAYPGLNAFAEESKHFYEDQARRQQLEALEALLEQASGANGLRDEISRRIEEMRTAIAANPYTFNRRFVMKALSMGHSQLAEFIGARGPNTQINCACASTGQALSLAEDWIRVGRCKRVVVVSADDVTSDHLMGWLGTGFLASGAAATGEVLEETALPFDRRRNGLLLGMGAAGIVVETAESARERGIRPICEILGTLTANSAFHATRLDVTHIGGLMESLISQAEKTAGISRRQMAPETVFVSHETYTPARGGSASAEINALRRVFGEDADRIVIANTKGFTGHAMGTGIEEVVAVKALETGCVPPVANFKEIDPELGALNLSKGGAYPVQYALRLAAGFGSQISLNLLRWVKPPNGARSRVNALGYATRVADPNAWKAWLEQAAGQPAPELEVVQRTLRVKDLKTTARQVANQEAQSVAAAAPVVKAAAAAAAGPAFVAKPAVPAPVSQVKVAVAPPPPPAPPKPVVMTDPVQERILALVVEKTGYPKDMLDLDLDLEADLGVDTVKQAELMAAIREIYNIERDENLKLRDFPTLKHVIGFVYSKRPDLSEAKAKATQQAAAQPQIVTAAPVVTAPVPAAVPVVAVTVDPVQEAILALVVEKTGYPKDMLDLDLDLEADLGVDTVKQAELMAAIRGIYSIERDENLKLRDFPTLKHVIGFVYSKRPDLAEAKAKAVQQAAAQPQIVTAAPVAAAPVAATAPAVAVVADPVQEAILALVVEKTGYPKDMLDLDLDLEADLGVDTVKQAELMAAIRGIYSIERDENLKLRDFPTLKHVIGFVYSKRPDLAEAKAKAVQQAAAQPQIVTAAPVAAAPVAATAPAVAVVADPVQEAILALVVEKTGYPKDMLDLELDLEADLGVDTVKQAELMAAIRGIYSIERDENLKLRDFPTLKHVIGFVYSKRPDLAEAKAKAAQQVAQAVAPPPAQTVEVPAPAPVTVAVEAVAEDPVKETILTLVVEKTGYPKDMLDLELDLEADLGVDTVKQAELMAAIRGIYSIERDENLKLRDFPTLKHVIGFVYSKRPDLAVAPPPAPTVAVPAPAPVAVAAQAVADDPVTETILALVVEKTGYPKDMLDLDLDLEADLGVDTVKQAELLAAIRGIYNIPRDENLKLRDFPTLRLVIKFAHDKLAEQGGTPVAVASAVEEKPQAAAPVEAAPILASLEAANSIPRRVPVPVLRPALTYCKPTGVALGPGSRVVLMPDKGGVADALTQLLQAFDVEVLRIDETLDAEALANQLNGWLAAGPVQGVYWLPALDNEGDLSQMDLAGWSEALQVRVKSLYTTMRALYQQIAAPGTFLVSAVRLGGQHGYDAAGAVAPLGGAVTGFTKTYKRERADVLVKAVDFQAECEVSQLVEILIDETLRDPGAVEVGYKEGQRWTVGLQELPAADGQPGMTLEKDSVFVVTGAAGGIVSAITGDLAAASGGTFYLLDLVPEPDPNNPDLAKFVSDKDGLKRDLIARIQARGERATPAMIERELGSLERAQAAWKAIDKVRAAGGTAHYFSVNLNDAEGVAKVINQVRERSGRIDVLLHAAGMERSHFLPDKDQREFDLVFDVKSNGWFNLLHAIGDMPLGATVSFSSIAGRFGNGGQADYSAANDLLCKITSSFRTKRPATRGIAIDWTAWGGIGMATRGSIPKMMELAGIDMLPPEAGVPLIRRELTAGGTRGEIVVAQRLGILLKEFDSTGGLDMAAVEASSENSLPAQGLMIGKIVSSGLYSGQTIETTLDPKIQPFLHDHQIDGTPVLPGVMGIESFAEAALALLPGWNIEAIEGVNFLAPFKFYRNKPRAVTVEAVSYPLDGAIVADCRLIGHRTIKKQAEPEVTTHFTGRVRLTKQSPELATVAAVGEPAGRILEAADIYHVYFHGPAYQVLARAWRDGDRIIGQMKQDLPGHHNPPERLTLVTPRLIELCFQTAGLWEMAVQNRMGLPQYVKQLRFGRAADLAEGPLYAVVTPNPDGSFDVEVVDMAGNMYIHLLGYRTVALPYSVKSEPLNVLQAAEAVKMSAD